MRRISCVKNLFKKTVEFSSCYGGNIKFFFLAATYNSSRYKTSSILILMLKLCVSTNRAQKKSGPGNTNNQFHLQIVQFINALLDLKISSAKTDV